MEAQSAFTQEGTGLGFLGLLLVLESSSSEGSLVTPFSPPDQNVLDPAELKGRGFMIW